MNQTQKIEYLRAKAIASEKALIDADVAHKGDRKALADLVWRYAQSKIYDAGKYWLSEGYIQLPASGDIKGGIYRVCEGNPIYLDEDFRSWVNVERILTKKDGSMYSYQPLARKSLNLDFLIASGTQAPEPKPAKSNSKK